VITFQKLSRCGASSQGWCWRRLFSFALRAGALSTASTFFSGQAKFAFRSRFNNHPPDTFGAGCIKHQCFLTLLPRSYKPSLLLLLLRLLLQIARQTLIQRWEQRRLLLIGSRWGLTDSSCCQSSSWMPVTFLGFPSYKLLWPVVYCRFSSRIGGTLYFDLLWLLLPLSFPSLSGLRLSLYSLLRDAASARIEWLIQCNFSLLTWITVVTSLWQAFSRQVAFWSLQTFATIALLSARTQSRLLMQRLDAWHSHEVLLA